MSWTGLHVFSTISTLNLGGSDWYLQKKKGKYKTKVIVINE